MSTLDIVVISLSTSVERRKIVATRLDALARPWRFFDAHTAADNKIPHDPERALIHRGYRMKPGEVGCFSSHLECLRQYAASADSTAPYMLVLEDDVVIDTGFDLDLIPELMSSLRIDYLKLFSRFMTRVRYLGRVGEARGLYRFVVPPCGTQAYVVSKAGARRFVESIHRIDRPIDDEMERYWVNGLPTYALFPYPFMELSMQSTVPKGFSADAPLSGAVKFRWLRSLWWNKLLRERTNRQLLATDRELSRRLAEIRARPPALRQPAA